LLPHLLTLWVCKLLMLICILTKNVITSCSVTMMLFLHLEVKPLMTLTTTHADCYQYFCVPEYGTANGRLHFHAVHFMRTLPTGSVDPNFGRRVRNRRQLNSLQNTWPYGYSMPI